VPLKFKVSSHTELLPLVCTQRFRIPSPYTFYFPKPYHAVTYICRKDERVLPGKKSSLIFSAASLNKHLFFDFVSCLFLLFSQCQFSKCYRTAWSRATSHIRCQFSFVHHICLWHKLLFCSFHSCYWFLSFHFVVTGVDHLIHMSAVFYPVQLILFLVFLISDIVNETPTRHIIIKIYFHILCIFSCTSIFVSSSNNSNSKCFSSFKCLVHFLHKNLI